MAPKTRKSLQQSSRPTRRRGSRRGPKTQPSYVESQCQTPPPVEVYDDTSSSETWGKPYSAHGQEKPRRDSDSHSHPSDRDCLEEVASGVMRQFDDVENTNVNGAAPTANMEENPRVSTFIVKLRYPNNLSNSSSGNRSLDQDLNQLAKKPRPSSCISINTVSSDPPTDTYCRTDSPSSSYEGLQAGLNRSKRCEMEESSAIAKKFNEGIRVLLKECSFEEPLTLEDLAASIEQIEECTEQLKHASAQSAKNLRKSEHELSKVNKDLARSRERIKNGETYLETLREDQGSDSLPFKLVSGWLDEKGKAGEKAENSVQKLRADIAALHLIQREIDEEMGRAERRSIILYNWKFNLNTRGMLQSLIRPGL